MRRSGKKIRGCEDVDLLYNERNGEKNEERKASIRKVDKKRSR